jgi:hypothetical protein
MFCSYTKEQILGNIKLKDAPLDHGYTLGQPNDINVGRYRLTECTTSQIDTSSQSIIRYCIDLIMDERKECPSRVYLSSPFDVNFLLYELHNACFAGFIKSTIKYISNNNSKFCETVSPNSDYNLDKRTIFVTDNPNLCFNETINIIIVSDNNVYIRI